MSRTEDESKEHSESALLTSLLRNTAQQGSLYFISVLVTAVVGFAVLPIFARIFSPAEYGLLSLALLVVSMGNIFIGNWLTSCTTRFMPYYQRIHKTDIFYSTILLSIILSMAAFLLLGTSAYLMFRASLSAEFLSLISLIAILIPLTTVFQISLTILRVKQEAKRYVAFQLGFTCLALIIGLSLSAFLGMGVSGILWGQAIVLFVLVGAMFRGLFITGSNLRPIFVHLPRVREFALYGFPAAASTIGTWILSGADRYVIEYFRGTAEVGLYSMGYTVSSIIMMLVTAFMLTATPTLMLTYESHNREVTSRLLSQLTRVFLLIGLPATVGISVLAVPIIRLLTTEPYYSASIAIPFVALGNFAYGLCLLSYTGLQTAKKSPIMARNWFAAGVFNILLNIIFVPKFGFVAAAVTTMVSYVALLILNIKSANKYLKWVVMPRSAINSTLASLIMGGAVFLIIHVFASAIMDCILGVITGIVVYTVILFLLKEFSHGEISQLRGFLKSMRPWARHS